MLIVNIIIKLFLYCCIFLILPTIIVILFHMTISIIIWNEKLKKQRREYQIKIKITMTKPIGIAKKTIKVKEMYAKKYLKQLEDKHGKKF